MKIEMSVLIVQASVVMEPAGIGSEGSSVCVVQGLNQGQTTHAKILMSAVGHKTIVLSGA